MAEREAVGHFWASREELVGEKLRLKMLRITLVSSFVRVGKRHNEAVVAVNLGGTTNKHIRPKNLGDVLF